MKGETHEEVRFMREERNLHRPHRVQRRRTGERRADTVLIMSKFKVAITRTESQVFTIEAQDSTEAVEKISDAWDDGRIELDNPEITDTDFSLIGKAE